MDQINNKDFHIFIHFIIIDSKLIINARRMQLKLDK